MRRVLNILCGSCLQLSSTNVLVGGGLVLRVEKENNSQTKHTSLVVTLQFLNFKQRLLVTLTRTSAE